MAPEELAAAEEGEGWDGLDIVLGCGLLVLIHIDLDDAEAVTKLCLELFQDWVHGFTGTVPGGKEIDQHRAVCGDNIVEGFLYSVHKAYWMACFLPPRM